jgi:hypothetical protein
MPLEISEELMERLVRLERQETSGQGSRKTEAEQMDEGANQQRFRTMDLKEPENFAKGAGGAGRNRTDA